MSEIDLEEYVDQIKENYLSKKRHLPHPWLISRGIDYLENFTNSNKGDKEIDKRWERLTEEWKIADKYVEITHLMDEVETLDELEKLGEVQKELGKKL